MGTNLFFISREEKLGSGRLPKKGSHPLRSFTDFPVIGDLPLFKEGV
jgi:hypothetical protein